MHRSYLYVPGNRPDLMAKVHRTGTDALVIDLEDAVPLAEKSKARQITSDALKTLETLRTLPIYLRLNAGAIALEDIAGIGTCKIAGVRLAKAEDTNLIKELAVALEAIEAARDMAPFTIQIQPLIESVKGLHAMAEMAAASVRVRSFVFGAGDFVIDIRGEATPSRIETLLARSHMVLRSRQLKIDPPIAHVFMPIKDLEGLKRACAEDRALGFHGRSCIHPTQVSVVNEAFSISAERIAHARKVIDAFHMAQADGRGALVLDDGTFVDEAVVKGARRVLASIGKDIAAAG